MEQDRWAWVQEQADSEAFVLLVLLPIIGTGMEAGTLGRVLVVGAFRGDAAAAEPTAAVVVGDGIILP